MTIPISNVNKFRHKVNPLHLYCRLVDVGLCADDAKTIAHKYEYFFKKFDNIVLMPTQRIEYYFRKNGNRKNEDYIW